MSNSTNDTLTEVFTLGTAADMSITGVTLFLYIVEFFLLLFVVIGQEAYLQFSCYRYPESAKKKKARVWNHSLLLGTLVFVLYQIMTTLWIMVDLIQLKVWLADMCFVVGSLSLFDVQFGLFLMLLANIAKTTFAQTPHVQRSYIALIVIVAIICILSVVMSVYEIVVLSTTLGLFVLRNLTLYGYIPVIVATKIIFCVLFMLLGGRIVYSICSNTTVTPKVRRVAIRIMIGMIVIIISTIIIFAGLIVVFAISGSRLLIGLLICITIPELLFFLVMILLFWPSKFVKKIFKVQEKNKTVE
jgi:hypothetical protein